MMLPSGLMGGLMGARTVCVLEYQNMVSSMLRLPAGLLGQSC